VLRAALEEYPKLGKRSDAAMARLERAMGVCLAALGRDAAAEPLLVESLRTMEANPGTGWRIERSREESLQRLVDFYESRGRRREALAVRAAHHKRG
jgi:hypothetical protein